MARELFLGINSGTSADGVDACLAAFEGDGPKPRFAVLAHRTRGMPAPLSDEIRTLQVPGADREGAASDVVDRLLALEVALAGVFAAATRELLARVGLPASRVRALGLHGQTVRHRPHGTRRGRPGASLQLAGAARVAELTGIPVVHDFRARDLASGGEGAPLVPILDLLAFAGRDGAVVLNLGGIANLCWVPPRGSRRAPVAYDTGPANALLDAACRLSGRVPAGYDRGGRLAAQGRVLPRLLARWLAHPYFARRPPKSTGQEDFGARLVEAHLKRHRLEDVLATLVELTAKSVGRELARLARGGRPATRVVVSGGGWRNPVLRAALLSQAPGLRFETPEAYGIPPAAKEALLFALLARHHCHGIPGNVPAATGAGGARVLGSLTPGDALR